MTAEPSAAGVTRRDVAGGAALAGLARAGALIEAVTQPAFIWLFGLPTYGLYVVLWAAINFSANLVDLGMTSALQRVVPQADGEEEAHRRLRFALLLALGLSSAVALGAIIFAEPLAARLSAAPGDRASLPLAIRLFAPALPLWVFVEVCTAAARARRAFGPEIRLRIFWEQIARLAFALLFWAAGARALGLMLAHLCSLALVALLSLRLLGRYYDLRLLLRAPRRVGTGRLLVGTGLSLLPAELTRRALIDLPPVVLSLMLPGARGATAAGLFDIGRKLSTVPLVVRQAFQYVLAPLSAAATEHELAPIYRFASRATAALVLPLAALLCFAARDILSLYRPEAAAAGALLAILVAGRAFEALLGPAATVVEMTGHRLLPLLNSAAGVATWAVLLALLVPRLGGTGMAAAVAAGAAIVTVLAAVELRWTRRLSPIDRGVGTSLLVAGAGALLMAGAAALPSPARPLLLLLLWAATSWVALRFGLGPADHEALGKAGRKLRLAR